MTEQKRYDICYSIFCIALVVILMMAILPLMRNITDDELTFIRISLIARYVYAAAAATAIIARLLMPRYKGTNRRIARLHRMEYISTLCYGVSAFFIFYSGAQTHDWLAFLTAGAMLQVYAAFTITYEEKKEQRKIEEETQKKSNKD